MKYGDLYVKRDGMIEFMTISTAYARAHYAARKNLASECGRCGAQDAKLEAALRPDAAASHLMFDEITGALYSADVNDYFTLCTTCHRRLDLVEQRQQCGRGHAYTPENTSVKPDGSRRCLRCHRENEARRLANNPEALEAKRAANRKRPPLTAEQKARKLALQRLRRQRPRMEHP